MTLIALDVAKLRVKLVQQDDTGVWSEVDNPAYSPVLRKPNHFQNRIQFWESYILAKLSTGNTYVLKRRDSRGVVTALYVLDPRRVTPLVTDDGDVYYQLAADNLPGLPGDLVVPAREIIHDRMNTIYHPLVGTSPIVAAGIAATQGLNIQGNFTRFFGNGARPGGILKAPGNISDETAKRLKENRAMASLEWNEPEDLEDRIKSAAAEAVAALPVPKDGEPGKDGIDGRDGTDGKDGMGVKIEDVMPDLQRRVDEYLATLPMPKDGRDGVDGKDGASVKIDDVMPVLAKRADEYLAHPDPPERPRRKRRGARREGG